MLILRVHDGSKFEHEDDLEGFTYHDSAAVLMQDGEIIAAIEEERLNRMKISREIFAILAGGNGAGEATFAERLALAGVDSAEEECLLDELIDLWGRRVVWVRPQAEAALRPATLEEASLGASWPA